MPLRQRRSPTLAGFGTRRRLVPPHHCDARRISVSIVNPWEQLLEGVELPFHRDLTVPALTEVMLPIPHPEAVADVEATAHQQVVQQLAGSVDKGMTVAVGAGSRGLVERVALLRGAISRPTDPRRRAVRRAGDGQPRRSHGRGPAADAGDAGHDRRGDRLRDPGDDGHRRGCPNRRRHAAVPRPQRGRCRPDHAGQPHQAAHLLQGPDRERPDEDGGRRVRQAAGRGPDPRLRPRGDAQPAAQRHRRVERQPVACSAASVRWSQRTATSSRCAR